MTQQRPLFNMDTINTDSRIVPLCGMARCLFFQLVFMANANGGYIRLGSVCLDLEAAAASFHFVGPIGKYVQDIIAQGLLAEDDIGWFVPEMRAAQTLRDKRSMAGRKGGESTTANRTDVAANDGHPAVRKICLSKPKTIGNVRVYGGATKKEKRTKKEKNNGAVLDN